MVQRTVDYVQNTYSQFIQSLKKFLFGQLVQ